MRMSGDYSEPGSRDATAQGLRVLVVEDDFLVQTLLSQALAGLGCEVHCAGTRREGLNTLRSRRFDLLVADLGLPDGRGADIVVERRRQDPYAPTLVITGLVGELADPAVKTEPLLQKPFGVDDFERKVRQLVAA